MRSSTTFSVFLWVYAVRTKNNKTNIYARITVNGNKVNMSLKEKANTKLWDAKGQRAKGNQNFKANFSVYLCNDLTLVCSMVKN